MQIILHRVNLSIDLKTIPKKFGVEVDIRSSNGNLILQHDPFKQGETFIKWLDFWKGQFLVLNVKEEGLEEEIQRILSKREIKNYFFLDQSFPFLVKTIKSGNTKVSARVSDLESLQTAVSVECDWVWIDCFEGDWNFLKDVIPVLKSYNKKICLVSPELVRNHSDKELKSLKLVLQSNNLSIDAVCTKNAAFWV